MMEVPRSYEEPRCARCGRTTEESEHKSLGLTQAGWLCDGDCRAAYEGGEWPWVDYVVDGGP